MIDFLIASSCHRKESLISYLNLSLFCILSSYSCLWLITFSLITNLHFFIIDIQFDKQKNFIRNVNYHFITKKIFLRYSLINPTWNKTPHELKTNIIIDNNNNKYPSKDNWWIDITSVLSIISFAFWFINYGIEYIYTCFIHKRDKYFYAGSILKWVNGWYE